MAPTSQPPTETSSTTSAPPSAHWLIYALGGGLGHLTRSLSLARAARARGVRATILTNSPLAARARDTADLATLATIPATASRTQVATAVRDHLLASDHDLLVVDTFPRGLAGELPDIFPALAPRPRALVNRYICRAYAESARLAEQTRHFDAVICPGDPTSLPGAVATAPWLIRDADELFSRADARSQLGASTTQAVVLVAASGRPEEVAMLTALATRLADAFPHAHVHLASHWPIFPLLRGADCIVGGGGYNLAHEARAAGVPLVGFAFPRLYDRQHLRLDPKLRVDSAGAAIAAVHATLARRGPPPLHPAAFENGAHRAVALLHALLV